jgi:alpha-amylase
MDVMRVVVNGGARRGTAVNAGAPGWPRVAALVVLAATVLGLGGAAWAQAGFEDDRVMLQGFYWESNRFGHVAGFGNDRWYDVVRGHAAAIADARFDLVWLPPPSYAGDSNVGYGPREYFRLDNNYGTFDQHRALLVALLKAGVEPVADIVVNHRNGSTGWADFKNPDWGTWAICADDEAFSNPASGIKDTPRDQRGNCEEAADYMSSTTYAYGVFRDIAHTDKRVRADLVRHLLQLRSLGYRGWRYDMVHGYHAKWIACYNAASKPTFSVGEFDWGAHNQQRGWIWNSSTSPGAAGVDHLKTSSDVFDFTTFYSLAAIKDGRYASLYGFGNGIGMVGDTTDGMPWKNRSVTFVENHDTGYRTNDDGTPQDDHRFDTFANGWQVEQAYAQVLTHPGVPTVYWKHYFDWGSDLQAKIKALINARKVAGIHAGSTVNLQDSARAAGAYAARIAGRNGDLYVRIGGSDAAWQPSDSKYSGYREYAAGAGWKVWVGLPGNPPVRHAPGHAAFPVPTYKKPSQISVPDEPLCR